MNHKDDAEKQWLTQGNKSGAVAQDVTFRGATEFFWLLIKKISLTKSVVPPSGKMPVSNMMLQKWYKVILTGGGHKLTCGTFCLSTNAEKSTD